ncbi:uncharacterized protein LOC130034428 [Sorex fumeus]|uniref:uncharacterized protein LOC130034428 n=1 Tax=Sorex fumeus TaxID=62283 RepID=UPI0024AE854B|nr:uncharacterized protein LOC130034428 [Sorex fumeus]
MDVLPVWSSTKTPMSLQARAPCEEECCEVCLLVPIKRPRLASDEEDSDHSSTEGRHGQDKGKGKHAHLTPPATYPEAAPECHLDTSPDSSGSEDNKDDEAHPGSSKHLPSSLLDGQSTLSRPVHKSQHIKPLPLPFKSSLSSPRQEGKHAGTTKKVFDPFFGKVKRKRPRNPSHLYNPQGRPLEYKNLPFKIPHPHKVLSQVTAYCDAGEVTKVFLLLHFTRGHDVQERMDAFLHKLATFPNVSFSTVFNLHHTPPRDHNRATVKEMTSNALRSLRDTWMLPQRPLAEPVTGLGRTSDFRTLLIQCATPYELFHITKEALKVCLAMPKKVCVRTCKCDQGSMLLSLYDDTVAAYMRYLYEDSESSSDED